MATDRQPDGADEGEAAARKRRWLTPGVGAVGAASFCSDAGHEMTTSVLPTFLTATLGAPASAMVSVDGDERRGGTRMARHDY
jgi:hypothetical protein